MAEDGMITGLTFAMVGSLTLLLFMLASGRRSRLEGRLQDLAGRGETSPDADSFAHLARSALPKMGAPLLPKDAEERTRLQTRLVHAGLYSREAMVVYLGAKMCLVVAPVLVGLVLSMVGLFPLQKGVIFGALAGTLGLIGPSFLLDQWKLNR